MAALPFFWIDAFTSTPLLGNPCAVVLDADGLEDGEMVRIAREMNQSEIAFVTASEVADFGARYFTPAEEIPLAGHPTRWVTRALLALRRARMNVKAYRALRDGGDFFSPHLFVREGATPEGDTFARHFGVPPDTLEDPFTGSATGGMAANLWRHGLLDRPRFVAEQGHHMGRPGSAIVEIEGPPGSPEVVRVAGEAVTVVRGEIYV